MWHEGVGEEVWVVNYLLKKNLNKVMLILEKEDKDRGGGRDLYPLSERTLVDRRATWTRGEGSVNKQFLLFNVNRAE